MFALRFNHIDRLEVSKVVVARDSIPGVLSDAGTSTPPVESRKLEYVEK
jgi:hypothetical protein